MAVFGEIYKLESVALFGDIGDTGCTFFTYGIETVALFDHVGDRDCSCVY